MGMAPPVEFGGAGGTVVEPDDAVEEAGADEGWEEAEAVAVPFVAVSGVAESELELEAEAELLPLDSVVLEAADDELEEGTCWYETTIRISSHWPPMDSS